MMRTLMIRSNSDDLMLLYAFFDDDTDISQLKTNF